MSANYFLQVLWDNKNFDDESLTVNHTQLGIDVYTKFMKTLGKKKNKCHFSYYEFLVYLENGNVPFGDFLFFSTVMETAKCSMNVLVASLLEPVDKEMKVRSKDMGYLNIMVALVSDDNPSFTYYNKRGAITIAYGSTFPSPRSVLNLRNLITCPRVEVRLSQILPLPNDVLKERLLSLFENRTQLDERNITEVLHICVDEYLAMSHGTTTAVRLTDLRVCGVMQVIANTIILLLLIY